MLSGESAAGKYPVEAVSNMAQICEFTEQHISYEKRFTTYEFRIKNTLDAISHATCAMSIDVGAKAIVVNSVSGTTARMVSRFRSPVDIVGMTTDKKVWRKLSLSWGVKPMLSEKFVSVDVMFYKAMECAKQALGLQSGDNVVLTAGPINGQSGNTNTIKVEQIVSD
jgi:pyruvate kinase